MTLPDAPETHYARRDGVHIAYQVLGEGPIDVADERWGTTSLGLSPSVREDVEVQRWTLWATRLYASPGTAILMGNVWNDVDVRDVLPSIRVPTLVIHREGRARDVDHALDLSEHIVGANLVAFPGADYSLYYEHADAWMDEVQEFLTGVRPAPANRIVFSRPSSSRTSSAPQRRRPSSGTVDGSTCCSSMTMPSGVSSSGSAVARSTTLGMVCWRRSTVPHAPFDAHRPCAPP